MPDLNTGRQMSERSKQSGDAFDGERDEERRPDAEDGARGQPADGSAKPTPGIPEIADLPEDVLRIASAAAHQLKSPLSSVQTILATLIGGFAGPLDARQRWLLQKALERCSHGVTVVKDMMRLRSLEHLSDDALGPVSLVGVVSAAVDAYREPARQKGVGLESEVALDAAERGVIRGETGLVREIVSVLVDNAVKYTPKDGRVMVRMAERPGADGRDGLFVEVVDTGIGIPPDAYEHLFEEFYRAPSAKRVSSGGSGLGLSFAKRAADRLGGTLEIGPSAEGGVRAVLAFPRAAGDDLAVAQESSPEGTDEQPISQRVVVIGGVSAGSKAAAKIMRLDPAADVTIIEKGRFLAYSGCGLPYYISGVIPQQGALLESPLGKRRDSSFFHELKNVRTLELTEAIGVDRERRVVRTRSRLDGTPAEIPYDKLVLATGAVPRIPDVPGVDLEGIFTLYGVEDAEAVRERMRSSRVHDVVIVGGGLLGCQITEAVAARGARVTLVEAQSSILGIVDREIALLVAGHMEGQGVRVLTDSEVVGFEGDEKVTGVRLRDGRTLPCDFVLLAAGIRPEVTIAREAGLEIGETGAILVDEGLRTSDPDVFAIGDCAQQRHVVGGGPVWLPGTAAASIQGRVAAVNLCGGDEKYPGIVGTLIVKVFDAAVARTGLTQRRARQEGMETVSVVVPGPDRASFVPEAKPIILKLVADAETGRLIGGQAFGCGEVAKRIDVLATALMSGLDLDGIAHLNLGYAPHFAMAIDNVITAANVLRNKLDGAFVGVGAEELAQEMAGADPPVLLDVRLMSEFSDQRLRGSRHIPLGVLRSRVHELPKNEPIVLVCSIGLRSYEASLILRRHGFENVRVLDGGLEAWPFSVEALA